MRVITGMARGRKLYEPVGSDIRPTTDQVKEAIFNIIQFDIEGRRVLDLFSGTGQLGIEALSRGAAEVVFIDSSRESVKLTQKNVDLINAGDRAKVYCRDALGFLSSGEKFDVIIMDPPYDTALLDDAIEAIIRFDILKDNGIMVCESAKDKPMPELSGPYSKGREYRYGKIKLTVYLRSSL